MVKRVFYVQERPGRKTTTARSDVLRTTTGLASSAPEFFSTAGIALVSFPATLLTHGYANQDVTLMGAYVIYNQQHRRASIAGVDQ